MKPIKTDSNSRFFAIVICADSLDGNLFQALRSAQLGVLQVGGDYTLVVTQHREKMLAIRNLLSSAGIAPGRDYLCFEEFDESVVTATWVGRG